MPSGVEPLLKAPHRGWASIEHIIKDAKSRWVEESQGRVSVYLGHGPDLSGQYPGMGLLFLTSCFLLLCLLLALKRPVQVVFVK